MKLKKGDIILYEDKKRKTKEVNRTIVIFIEEIFEKTFKGKCVICDNNPSKERKISSSWIYPEKYGRAGGGGYILKARTITKDELFGELI